MKLLLKGLLVASLLALGACGGGSSSSNPPNDPTNPPQSGNGNWDAMRWDTDNWS